MLFGCSSGTAVVASEPDGGYDATSTETDGGTPDPEPDSGDEPDAGEADACAAVVIANTVYASQDCELLKEPCSTCTGGRLYRCKSPLGPSVPGVPPADGGDTTLLGMARHAGCEQVDSGVELADFCCPLAWVARASKGSVCPGTTHTVAFQAPVDENDVPLAPLPLTPKGCVNAGGGIACCRNN